MATKKKKTGRKAKPKAKPSARKVELSAGGVVMRGKKQPLFAVVLLRQQKLWVLPKGKLRKGENELQAARREAAEETGRNVEVHEYLGQIAYKSENDGQHKVVKFWRMQARGKPMKLMNDIEAVRWLPLEKAIAKLSREREQNFLRRVADKSLGVAAEEETSASALDRVLSWLRTRLRSRS